jgi:predicted enzyme related to lactoylglutathione lyase
MSMDAVMHFEIPVDDLDRAKRFYGSIFGWDLKDTPGMDYTSVETTPVDEQQRPKDPGAINGGMFKRTAEMPVSVPVITIIVNSIDDALKQVESFGGTVVKPSEEIPGMGSYAYAKDTEGNIFGLWQNVAS